MIEARAQYRPPEPNNASASIDAFAPIRERNALAQAQQSLDSLFDRPVSVADAEVSMPGRHTAIKGIHPAPAPVELPHAYYESPVALGPVHPSKAMGGAIFDQSMGTWRPRTGSDYVTANASGLPAGMEGELTKTPEYLARLEEESLPQLTPSERLSANIYRLIQFADRAPQNIRDAVTAFWDNAKGWIPPINKRTQVALSAAATLAASTYLSACGGQIKAVEPKEPTPAVTIYAPTAEPTIVPTATETPPTPTATATAQPTPEIRPSVTPDPGQITDITFAQLRKTLGAEALVGTLETMSDTKKIAPNFDRLGNPTFEGVRITVSTQKDKDGKVIPNGSFPSFTVIQGPDTGVVQKGAFYAPAFSSTIQADGTLRFKFYPEQDPVILLPTTLQKIFGETGPVRISTNLSDGTFVVMDKNNVVIGSTRMAEYDHLRPDQMNWNKIKPKTTVEPTPIAAGTVFTDRSNNPITYTLGTVTPTPPREEITRTGDVKVNQLTESSFTIEGHPLVSKVKIDSLNINGTEFVPKAEKEFAKQLADFATNAVLLNHVIGKHEGALPKTEAQLAIYMTEMEAARTALTAQGSLTVTEARPKKYDPNGTSSITRYGTTVKPGMGVSVVDMARKDLGLPQDMFPIVTNGGSSKYSKFLVGIDSKTNTLIIGMNSEGMQDLPAQAPALGTTAGMLLVDIATQDVMSGLIWMSLGSRLSNEKVGSVNAADYGVSGYGKLTYNFPSNNRKGNVSDAFTRFLVEKVAGKTALQQNASDQPVFDFVAKK